MDTKKKAVRVPSVEATKNILTISLLSVIGAGIVVIAVGLIQEKKLLPLNRSSRRVPWGPLEIILAFVAMYCIQAAAFKILQACGLFRNLYGADPTSGDTLLTNRCGLWVTVISTPIVIVAVLASMHAVSRTRPHQIGLWFWRWNSNVACGYFAWITVTPLVFCIHLSANLWHNSVLHVDPKPHPIEQIFRAGGFPVEWVLMVAQAVIMAPILEEFLLRGVLQPWLAKGPHRSLGVWAAALGIAVVDREHRLEWLMPVAFVLLFGIVSAVATRGETGPEWRWRGILGSSILFAMMHVPAWPTPIPLFFLALALGWLAQRTRSLIGPIVLHALFNGISTMLLLCGFNF